MQRFKKIIQQVVGDEGGGEVLEWALVVGLLIIAAVTTMAAFGTKVMAKWTSVNASM